MTTSTSDNNRGKNRGNIKPSLETLKNTSHGLASGLEVLFHAEQSCTINTKALFNEKLVKKLVQKMNRYNKDKAHVTTMYTRGSIKLQVRPGIGVNQQTCFDEEMNYIIQGLVNSDKSQQKHRHQNRRKIMKFTKPTIIDARTSYLKKYGDLGDTPYPKG